MSSEGLEDGSGFSEDNHSVCADLVALILENAVVGRAKLKAIAFVHFMANTAFKKYERAFEHPDKMPSLHIG